MVFRMGTGKSRQDRYAFEEERARIGRQVAVALKCHRQTDHGIAFLNLPLPIGRGTDALEDQVFPKSPDHVQIEASHDGGVEFVTV